MISEIYDIMLSVMPLHKDHPFEMVSLKNGASVYLFGQRKALMQQRKDHVKLSIYTSGDDLVTFKVSSVDILCADPEFRHAVLSAYKHAKNNEPLEEFGCCNDFVACSDNKRCLHDDDPYYRGCLYRKNLESGRIFYGKNRNQEDGI